MRVGTIARFFDGDLMQGQSVGNPTFAITSSVAFHLQPGNSRDLMSGQFLFFWNLRCQSTLIDGV